MHKCPTQRIFEVLGIAEAVLMAVVPALGGTDAKRQPIDGPAGKPQVVANYGKLPLSFEMNGGQTNPKVKFLSRGKGYTLFLTGDGSALTLKRGAKSGVVRTRLAGANPQAQVSGVDRLPGTANYFIGNDPSKWHINMPSYGRVKYNRVYPGVDLVYYGNHGKLEYDFVVAPEADPSRIAMDVDGQLNVDERGDLVVATSAGEVTFQKPVAYQITRTRDKRPVDAAYVLTGRNQVSFRLAAYDRRTPLIIDPVLSYSTYLGGSGTEYKVGMAVDSAGNAYLTGETNSVDYPTASAEQAANAGGYDAFVTKINAAGTSVVYSTYLGGSSDDDGYGIAVDASGNAYIAGNTFSSDFPTVNAIQPVLGGSLDAFVAKLNATGNGLLYSTYLGGSSADEGLAIAVDGTGSAYVVGDTTSFNFPVVSPIQGTLRGARNGFVSKLDPAGALSYSTYLGGSGSEQAESVTVDGSFNAYVTGFTTSTDFPTVNPIQPTNMGGYDGFVAKINAAGSALVYSTYLGGTGFDNSCGIAVDASGNVFVAGGTSSTDFPTKHAVQPSYGGNSDAFVTKINAAGSALVYSTYLGGSGPELVGYPNEIAVDSQGNAYVTGGTSSTDFPTSNPTQSVNAGGYDAFVTKLNAAGSQILYSSYLGGSSDESAFNGGSVGVDAAGNIYVYGTTTSPDFPTVNPIQAANAGDTDSFLTKIGSGVSLSKTRVTYPTQVVGTESAAKTVTLTNIGSGMLTISSITSSDPTEFQVTTNTCGASVAAGGSCDIDVAFSPTASGTRTGKIKIADSELGSPQAITVTGTGTDVSLSPTRLGFGSHAVGTTSPAKIVTLTNVGTALVDIASIQIAGADSQDFIQSATTCGPTVLGGASCTITLRFKPTATGTWSATLDLNDDGGGSPQTVALSGTGS